MKKNKSYSINNVNEIKEEVNLENIQSSSDEEESSEEEEEEEEESSEEEEEESSEDKKVKDYKQKKNNINNTYNNNDIKIHEKINIHNDHDSQNDYEEKHWKSEETLDLENVKNHSILIRKDRFGEIIKKDGNQKVTFLDDVIDESKKISGNIKNKDSIENKDLIEVIDVESYKKFNIENNYKVYKLGSETCCEIISCKIF